MLYTIYKNKAKDNLPAYKNNRKQPGLVLANRTVEMGQNEVERCILNYEMQAQRQSDKYALLIKFIQYAWFTIYASFLMLIFAFYIRKY